MVLDCGSQASTPPPRRHSHRRCRRLFAADGEDEEGTLKALKPLWRDLADPKINEHSRSHRQKTTGDGFLVEFGVVQAVRCTVDVHREMACATLPSRRNGGSNSGRYQPQRHHQRPARNLAEPGGTCVSRVVHDQICDKLDFAFDDRGEQQLLARPIGGSDLRVPKRNCDTCASPTASHLP